MATKIPARITSSPGLRRELAADPPWSYPWRLDPGRFALTADHLVKDLQETRLAMIARDAARYLRADTNGAGMPGRAVHLNCADGWFCHRLRDLGAGYVLGIDGDEQNVRRARMVQVRFAIPSHQIDFQHHPLDRIRATRLGRFHVVLVTGLGDLAEHGDLLRRAALLTGGIALIECSTAEGGTKAARRAAMAAGFGRIRIADPSTPASPPYISGERSILIAEPRGHSHPREPVRLSP